MSPITSKPVTAPSSQLPSSSLRLPARPSEQTAPSPRPEDSAPRQATAPRISLGSADSTTGLSRPRTRSGVQEAPAHSGRRFESPDVLRERRHSRKRQQKRSQRTRIFALVASLLALVGGYAGGHLWVAWRSQGGDQPPPVSALRQAEALRVLDEAITAKYRQDYATAKLRIGDAMRLDPEVQGAEAILAEIAFAERDRQALHQHAERAVSRNSAAADAYLLLALDAWFARGVDRNIAGAEARASDYLAKAAAIELENPDVSFFWGDILRTRGREEEAHRRIAGGLFRLNPAHSYYVVGNKMALAAVENGGPAVEGADKVPVDAPSVPGATALAEALRALRDNPTADVNAQMITVASGLTGRQFRSIAADSALAKTSAVNPSLSRFLSNQVPDSGVPFAEIEPPAAGESSPDGPGRELFRSSDPMKLD